jgi:hypothetical protein
MAANPRALLTQLRSGNLRLSDLHRSRAAVSAYGALRRGFERLGLQVVAKTFYSPIPDIRALPESVWSRRGELAGIDFQLSRQLTTLEGLAPFIREFEAPRAGPTSGTSYYFDNPSYGPVDAETLYAFVRNGKPSRIVELGSGFSTLVLGQAALENKLQGKAPCVAVYDPFPGVAGPQTAGIDRFEATRAQDVPLAVFDELGEGDILVVDTTHVVKLGGDVNRIVLDVLPRLAPGVLVHFHDIFLPWEYPRIWLERFGLFWTEQYLVQAFLACNLRFQVVCALHALAREHPDRLAQIYPSWRDDVAPGAFWIRSHATGSLPD